MDEKVFFERDDVQVTNARFTVGSQTYAVRNITSIAAWTKPRRWLWVVLCALFGIGGLVGGKDTFAAGPFLLLLAGAIYWRGRPRHYVKLSTASGEVMALENRDNDYILKVVNALNDAMVSQHKMAN